MTAVGKILVFFNLIFSLIVGAFVVTVYIAQTHWAAEYKDLSNRYTVSEASNAAYQKQLKEANDYTKELDSKVLGEAELAKLAGIKADDDVTAKLKKLKDTLKAAIADAEAKGAAADKARDDLSLAQKKIDNSDLVLTSAQAEVLRRQAESEANRALLKEETTKSLQLVKDLGKEHDQMVAWKIRAESAELRKGELEKENDKLAHDNQKLVASGGSLVASMKKDGPNPPLDNVEGVVREVSPSGLVRISIGSDAGLIKGNTLDAYRLNTLVPDQSKYLGRIKILEVTATEAVGQPMNKTAAPLQPGDTVSSKILGS